MNHMKPEDIDFVPNQLKLLKKIGLMILLSAMAVYFYLSFLILSN